MGVIFNPLLLSGLQFDSAATATSWRSPVTTEVSLPASGNVVGDARITTDTDYIWIWDDLTSRWINSGVKPSNVGATPNSQGYSLQLVNVGVNRTELQLVLQPADGSNPGIVSILAQTFSGNKLFNNNLTVSGVSYTDGGIDVTTPAATLLIGNTNAGIINLGNASSVVNFNGTVNNNNVTNLNVTDKLITINDGGAVGSGSGSGFEIEEAAVATGYVKSSIDRNSFEIKAPNTAGIAIITPGASGITLNQSSHDLVTVTDTNSIDLTISTQVLSADVRLSGATLAVDASGVKIATGGVTNNEVNASAAIDFSKLAILSSGNLIIGSALNVPTSTVVTGDIVISNAGVTAISANVIVDGDIAPTADIARSKLAPGTANRVILNDASGEISESAALTDGQIIIGSTGLAPVVSTLTGGSNVVITNGAGVITVSTGSSGDIQNTSWTGIINNTINQIITGFTFASATVGGFEALVRVSIDATSDLFAVYKLLAVQKAATTWDISVTNSGDTITGVEFSALDTAGTTQIRISLGNITGFLSGEVNFRATVVGL